MPDGSRDSLSSPRRRLVGLALLALPLLAALAMQLHRMQVVEGATWRQRARENTIRRDPVPALRGRILDRRGRTLVTNRPCYRLEVIPGDLRPWPAVARQLARILRMPAPRLEARLQRLRSEAPLEPLALRDTLGDTQLVQLAELQLRSPGIRLDARPRRSYPFGRLAAHVLGYVGEISPEELKPRRRKGYAAGDVIGKAGLDKQYDVLLRGRKGVRFTTVNPSGRDVKVLGTQKPVAGANLHLTIDIDLQRAAEEALAATLAELAKTNGKPSGGAVVVMDVHTGAIRALASLPVFDPAIFDSPQRDREYARLLADRTFPLLDRTWQGAWSPGSTFKLITASAALQEKLCTAGSTFSCGGSYQGASCFVRSGHGSISFNDSLALSCDVTYYRLGDLLGIDRLARYAGAFGLGRRTGIDLPDEETGILPTPAWKRRYARDEWYGGDTINTSIGQGFLVVTPLQMAVYTSAVANGGKVLRPYVVDRATTGAGRVVFRHKNRVVRKLPVSARLLAAVREGMRGAVTHGTGTAAQSEVVTLAGKTGTVENIPTADNPKGRNHVWFTCFGPYEKPQLVTVVFLEKAGGYGGQYASPVARKVMESWFGERVAPRGSTGAAGMALPARKAVESPVGEVRPREVPLGEKAPIGEKAEEQR